MKMDQIRINLLPAKRKKLPLKFAMVIGIFLGIVMSLSLASELSIGSKTASACHCGDGDVNVTGEECDGSAPKICTVGDYQGLSYCVSCLWTGCKTTEKCGDSIVNGTEQCDDGNADNFDACRINCTLPKCGDNIKDAGEECDDGNTNNLDACRNTCLLPKCGDGIKDAGEECDGTDGVSEGQTCSSTCTVTYKNECSTKGFDFLVAKWEWNSSQSQYVVEGSANDTYVSGDTSTANWSASSTIAGVISKEATNYYVHAGGTSGTVSKTGVNAISHLTLCGNNPECGNAIKETGEQCDDGNNTDGDGCSATCTVEPRCGDGITNGTEQCDDGNTNDSDACRNNCTAPKCGDSIIDAGEQCDDGNDNNLDDCRNTCVLPKCGDGIPNGTEQCDDGNSVDNDSCRNNCTSLKCGDGIKDAGEECDDGNDNNNDACRNSCVAPKCGDGTQDAGEECDDGNTNDDDSCSATCTSRIGSLEICKYNDINKNGIYDALSDLPLVWDFTIVNASTSATIATSTDATTGCLTITNLLFGDYQVAEAARASWVRSYPSDNPTTVAINSGNKNPKINFLNYEEEIPRLGSIKVCKMIDGDSLASTTDDRYKATSSAWTFNLVGAGGTTTLTTVVGDNCVTFSNLSAGTYHINETLPAGWQLVSPTDNNIDVILSSGENRELTFANAEIIEPKKGSLEIYKYYDINKNGIYDIATDTPLDWTFEVTGPIATTTVTTSTSTGYYQLTDLPLGTYQIVEETRTDWIKSAPTSGSTTVVLDDDNLNQQAIFLNYEAEGSITVCKMVDGDRLASTTEDRYSATSSVWTFNLISSIGTTTKATVIDNNCVTFTNLKAGSYQVNEVLPDGWQLIDPLDNSISVNLLAGENKSLTFANSIVVPAKGRIYGYKYNDANNNSVIDSGEQKMGDWTIQLARCPYTPLATSAIQFLTKGAWATSSDSILPGQCIISETTTTDSSGYYEFANLDAGDYAVGEVVVTDWVQTYPAGNTFYYFNLTAGTVRSEINFANYKPKITIDPYCGDGHLDAGEQCDDGNNRSGDGCSASCTTEGGGGGGGSVSYFNMYDTAVTEEDCNAVITWRTSNYATSRVYYDTEPHSTSTMPNKDYVFATLNDLSKVTGHNVTITGLKPNTTYYFRAYSEASSAQTSQEIKFKTGGQCGTTVKGEEGKPTLKIVKQINTAFANQNQKDIEYLITVTNEGNLTAYNVNLKDLLPKGLTYSDGTVNPRNWQLGDMKPGDSKAVTYKVDVDRYAEARIYTNVAEATADNADAVKTTADLEVRTVKVLAITGFSFAEFIIMFGALISLVGLSIFLRRKIVLEE